MRLATGGGWAAVKTAAFGGRVIAVRTKLTAEQLEALWEPIQAAIPLSSLSAPARTKR
jgi:starvation-inducible outer membrane lipoprotein